MGVKCACGRTGHLTVTRHGCGAWASAPSPVGDAPSSLQPGLSPAGPEPRQEDAGGRAHQPLPAGPGHLHQRAQREGRRPRPVRELPGQQTHAPAQGTHWVCMRAHAQCVYMHTHAPHAVHMSASCVHTRAHAKCQCMHACACARVCHARACVRCAQGVHMCVHACEWCMYVCVHVCACARGHVCMHCSCGWLHLQDLPDWFEAPTWVFRALSGTSEGRFASHCLTTPPSL